MKKLLALILAMVMLFTLAACGDPAGQEDPGGNAKDPSPTAGTGPQNAAGSETPDGKTTLKIAVDVDPGTLSPTGGSSSGNTWIGSQIFDTLIDIGPHYALQPMLAESWEQVDDLHYRIHLREGVKDSNGAAITASDVLFCFGLYMESSTEKAQVKYLDLANCKAEDDHTLLIAYSEPNAFQFQNFAKTEIFDQETYEKDPDAFGQDPVGSGPYKLQEYIPGSKVTLVYNENYWGEKPAIETVVFYIIAEPAQRTTALETGEVDVAMNLQSSDMEHVNGIDGLRSFAHTINRSEGFWLNTSENSILSDLNLRQAVCYAVDNAAIASVVFKGLAAPAVSACSTAMSDYDPSFNSEMYAAQDLAKAKSLVDAAGAAGKEFTIVTSGSADQIAAAEMIQQWINETGLVASIQSYEDAVLDDVLSDPAGGWDIALTNFRCGSNYVLDMYNAYLGNLNFSAWSGDAYDAFLKAAGTGCASIDDAVIKASTKEVIDLIQENCVVYNYVMTQTFVGTVDNLNVTSDTVYGNGELYPAVLAFGE